MNIQNVIEEVKKGTPYTTLGTFKAFPKPNEVKSGRVLQCFTNADMRNGHEGLAEVAKKEGIDVSKLHPGMYVIFINTAKDRIKLFASNNVVAYLKLPGGGRIDMRVIAEIPKAFMGSGRIDYDKVLRTTIEAALARKARQKAEA